MGNAQKFKNAIDKIQQNSEAQIYPLVFHEFGRIVNLIVLQIEPLTRRGTLDDNKSGFGYFLSMYPELEGFTSIEGVAHEIEIRIPKQYSEEGYNMTLGDKISTGVTIASGIAIAYVLEMHKGGKQVIDIEKLQQFEFNGKQMLINYEQAVKSEILDDLSQYRDLDSSLEQK